MSRRHCIRVRPHPLVHPNTLTRRKAPIVNHREVPRGHLRSIGAQHAKWHQGLNVLSGGKVGRGAVRVGSDNIRMLQDTPGHGRWGGTR